MHQQNESFLRAYRVNNRGLREKTAFPPQFPAGCDKWRGARKKHGFSATCTETRSPSDRAPSFSRYTRHVKGRLHKEAPRNDRGKTIRKGATKIGEREKGLGKRCSKNAKYLVS